MRRCHDERAHRCHDERGRIAARGTCSRTPSYWRRSRACSTAAREQARHGMVGAACGSCRRKDNLRRSRFEILESHQLPLPTFIAGTLILVAIVNVEKLPKPDAARTVLQPGTVITASLRQSAAQRETTTDAPCRRGTRVDKLIQRPLHPSFALFRCQLCLLSLLLNLFRSLFFRFARLRTLDLSASRTRHRLR